MYYTSTKVQQRYKTSDIKDYLHFRTYLFTTELFRFIPFIKPHKIRLDKERPIICRMCNAAVRSIRAFFMLLLFQSLIENNHLVNKQLLQQLVESNLMFI